MTHDELLKKLNKYYEDITSGQVWTTDVFIKALRAVVELHKPKEEDGKLWCEHEVCYNHIEFLERDDCDCSYPCPTLEAIEKELK